MAARLRTCSFERLAQTNLFNPADSGAQPLMAEPQLHTRNILGLIGAAKNGAKSATVLFFNITDSLPTSTLVSRPNMSSKICTLFLAGRFFNTCALMPAKAPAATVTSSPGTNCRSTSIKSSRPKHACKSWMIASAICGNPRPNRTSRLMPDTCWISLIFSSTTQCRKI